MWIIGILGIGVVITVVAMMVYSLSHIRVTSNNIHIRSVDVSSEEIVVTADFAGNSALLYNGYALSRRDDALFLTIKASYVRMISISGDPFTIRIPNDDPSIQKVYLVGDPREAGSIIWQKNP